MKIQVLKFGGTSVSTADGRKHVVDKIRQAHGSGCATAVVVSAMGRRGDPYATDTLLDMVLEVNRDLPQRELDMLTGCGECISGIYLSALLQKNGFRSMYLNGEQAGIQTNDLFGEARVLRVDTRRLLALLKENCVPIIPSGQGATADGEFTLLGRGGGDTSAAALGAALDAEATIIYTDVVGILSGDPRVIPEAKLIDRLSYANCTDLAYLGANVIHPRAVETAMQNPNMKLYIRSTFSSDIGTLVSSEGSQPGVVGIALQKNDTIFYGTVENHLRERLSALEINVCDVDGAPARFAIAAKDLKRFSEAAPEYQATERLHKISLVGSLINLSADDIRRQYQAVCMHKAAGFLSIWIQDDAETTARRLHHQVFAGR